MTAADGVAVDPPAMAVVLVADLQARYASQAVAEVEAVALHRPTRAFAGQVALYIPGQVRHHGPAHGVEHLA